MTSQRINNAWQSHCRELAQWAWDRLAIKRDRHGLYSPTGGASWTFSALTKDDLAAHFAGEITLGCGSISPDDQCLWVAWDLDNHVSDIATNVNLKFAVVLRDKLRALGFANVVIEDSDGKGGIHVWLFFSSPIPAKQAYQFSRWIASDYTEHGLETIEYFPKSRTSKTDKGCGGGYLRDPGKHHKRQHWSRCYGDDDWLSPADSVQLLLSQTGDDPSLIPAMPVESQRTPKPQPFMPDPDLTDRDEALCPSGKRA